jgi:ATP-dependent Zn protease
MDMQQNSNVDLSTQAIPPVSNNPKKSNGIVTSLLLLVLILLGFILFAFFTDRLDIGIKNPFTQNEQTESEEEKDTEESEELNVYTNNQFGVEFKYPNNWKVLEEKVVEDLQG